MAFDIDNLQIPPPKNPDDFENLCLDLYEAEFGDGTQLYGSKGQAQQGVDIFTLNQNIGVQCKKKEYGNGKITEKELKQEIEKAKEFNHKVKLKRYIYASTCKRDAKIQKIAWQISEEHKKHNLFSVEIHSWNEIEKLLNKHPIVFKKYYPHFYKTNTQPTLSSSLRNSIQSESRYQELNRIRDLLNENQPKTAFKLLENFEKDKWDQLEAKEKYKLLTNKAFALIEMQKRQPASALTIQALQFNKEDEGANFNCALAYFIRNDRENSKKYIEKVKALNPLNINTFILEIQIKDREKKDFKEIVSELSEELKTKPQIACMLSHISIKRKLYKEAEHWLNIFYKNREKTENGNWKNIKNEAVYADLSLSLILAKPDIFSGRRVPDNLKDHLKEIIKIYKKLVIDGQYGEIKEFNPNWHLHYALALELNGEFDEAVQALKTGIDNFPKDERLKIELSRLFEQTRQITKSIKILETLLSLESIDTKNSEKKIMNSNQMDIGKKSFPVFMMLSDLYFQNNQKDKTWKLLDKLEKSLSINEDQKVKIKQFQISRFIGLGKIKEAEEKLNPLFEKDKKNITYLILKSQVEKAKASENKIEVFKLYKEKNNEYLKLACNIFTDKYKNQNNRFYFESEEWLIEIQRLAHELYSFKMYEEAEPLLEKITNNNLNHPEVFKLSYIYFQNGKNRQAIELTEALLKKFPNEIDLVHVLSSIYESLGNREKAIQYYQEFLKSHPKNAFARIELAVAYINSEKISKAKELLNTSFDLNKLSIQQINRLALSYRSIGEIKKAIDIQYQNIKKNPDELEAQMRYFNLFISLNKPSLSDIKKEVESPNYPSKDIKLSDIKKEEAFLQPDKVDSDCYVKIRETKILEDTDIIIEKDADIYNTEHELSQTLLGKKIGDKIIFRSKEYQIMEIKNKYVYKYHELLKKVELKYGSKSPLQSLSLSKKPDKKEIEETLKKFIPVESSKQQEVLHELLQTYREGKVTIGILARIMGKHPIEMMYYLVSSHKDQWISAFPGWEHYKEAQEHLKQRSHLLLGLFSLIMIHKIKMEKYLEFSDFDLYICQSTIDSLKEYENKTAMYARDGHLTVGLDENNQLQKDLISPERVKQELRFLDKVKTWVKEHCKIKPLSEDFVLSRKERLEWERTIGKEFLDPLLALYNDTNTIFLSEDATLRDVFSQWIYQKFPLTDSKNTSQQDLQDSLQKTQKEDSEDKLKDDLSRQNAFFRSVRLFDLIHYLKNKAIIDNKEEVQFKAGLVEYHQTYIPVDHKILFYLLKKVEYVSSDTFFKRALFFLGPNSDLSGVIDVLGNFFIEVCQEHALSPYGRQMIINEVLKSVSFGREARSLANQILLNVQLKTQFLPFLQQEIQSYIMVWLKGNLL